MYRLISLSRSQRFSRLTLADGRSSDGQCENGIRGLRTMGSSPIRRPARRKTIAVTPIAKLQDLESRPILN